MQHPGAATDAIAAPVDRRCYRGRFAPSPTGPLHGGSLLTAVASWLDARARGGEWLLRIEDIDPPREVPGAAERIIDTLATHGLRWDGDILWQSQRHAAYAAALDTLRQQGRIFDCVCTRAQLGPGGTCGERCSPTPGANTAARLRLPAGALDEEFEDALRGPVHVPDVAGDIVLWRKDGLPAYQLAVTVDDAAQGITDVVRGSDLLEQTPVQRYLLACRGATPPRYAHLPLLVGADGRKLSKQNGAQAVDDRRPLENLHEMLALLGQPLRAERGDTPASLLARATERWSAPAVAVLPRELVYPAAPR